MVDNGDTKQEAGRDARERRLAEALRANLRRRKVQARDRRADPGTPSSPQNED